MPTDKESGMVEPDIIVNGRALAFAECMSVRVAVSSFRLSLTSQTMREGLGTLATNYDHHLARVEASMRERLVADRNRDELLARAHHRLTIARQFDKGGEVMADCEMIRDLADALKARP